MTLQGFRAAALGAIITDGLPAGTVYFVDTRDQTVYRITIISAPRGRLIGSDDRLAFGDAKYREEMRNACGKSNIETTRFYGP